ncbi:MAG: hypothetical protein ABIP51_13155, partial [Bacteroidia bacterium]
MSLLSYLKNKKKSSLKEKIITKEKDVYDVFKQLEDVINKSESKHLPQTPTEKSTESSDNERYVQSKKRWLWANSFLNKSLPGEDELFSSSQESMQPYYNKPNDTDIHTPTDGNVLRAENKKLDDKTESFEAVLSERRIWSHLPAPIAFPPNTKSNNPKETIIGVTIGPIYFRK